MSGKICSTLDWKIADLLVILTNHVLVYTRSCHRHSRKFEIVTQLIDTEQELLSQHE